MKFTHFFHSLTLAAIAGMGIHSADAQVATDPVGFVASDVPASSDVPIGLPLTRPPALETTVSGFGAANSITVAATLEAGQFTPGANRYYLRVKDTASNPSAVIGRWYEIVSSDATSITVDPAAAQDVQTQGLAVGDTVQVVPFWTLGTLFVDGSGVVPSPDPFSPQGTVRLYNQSSVGVNLAPTKSYLYYPGPDAPAGWYDAGDLDAGLQDAIPLTPDTFFLLRNPSGVSAITVVGSVPLGETLTTDANILQAGRAQDNLLVNPYPVPITLDASQLFEDGVVLGSADIFSPVDTVRLYVEGQTGVNTSPSKVYAYYTGSDAPVGWYDLGDLGAGVVGGTVEIPPGGAFVVRKAGGAVGSSAWTPPSPYVAVD